MRESVSDKALVLELSKRMKLDLDGVSQVSRNSEENIGTQNLAKGKGPLNSINTNIGIEYN